MIAETRNSVAAVGLILACACSSTPSQQTSKSATASASNKDREEAECLAHASAERAIPNDAPETIEVSHILVRHAELDRPRGTTRTRGQACLFALAALDALQGGADFRDVVRQYSDSGGATDGNLGTIGKKDVTPEFARAAFSLEENELSYVVETDRGFHIILRH